MRKLRLFRLLASLLAITIPATVNATQWILEKHDKQYQISIQNPLGDRLVLSRKGEDTRFVLLTSSGQEQPGNQRTLRLWFDNDTASIESSLTRIDSHTYLIQLSNSQKNEIISQMINRLELQIRYPTREQSYRDITFSLIGFTAVLNDLLIANEIGHLEPEWMNEHHKTQELMCFYAANFSVLAMRYRKQGFSPTEAVRKLKKHYSDVLDELIRDIVTQVYAMPGSKLPRDPRGDKFGIFQRCMQHYQQGHP